MTANQKRQAVVNQYKMLIGRNIYSQDVTRRECVFNPFTDGKYYSDCSSSIRWAYRRANIGLNNIGGNTVGMYTSPLGKIVDVNIVNGIPTDVSNLRVGDILLFAGSDNNRANWGFVGHVEMVYSISGNTVTLCGHGSGTPNFKNLNTYCRNRFNMKTNTKLGHRGLIRVVRFIKDDVKSEPVKQTSTPTVTTPTSNTTAKSEFQYYTVKSGDTLSMIAERFNTTVYNLVVTNKIPNANNIQVGQRLIVGTYMTYTVKAGDSLSRISQEMLGTNTRWKEIMDLNGLTSTTIRVGQVLKIPS